MTESYRHVHRRQLSPTGERTLINSLSPKGPSHIDGVVSVTFKSLSDLTWFSGLCSSLVFDFLITDSVTQGHHFLHDFGSAG